EFDDGVRHAFPVRIRDPPSNGNAKGRPVELFAFRQWALKPGEDRMDVIAGVHLGRANAMLEQFTNKLVAVGDMNRVEPVSGYTVWILARYRDAVRRAEGSIVNRALSRCRIRIQSSCFRFSRPTAAATLFI